MSTLPSLHLEVDLLTLLSNNCLPVPCLTRTSTNVNPSSEREAEILKPLVSVEVTEKEDAGFETEVSEDDVPGEWKLKGEVLTRSPVRLYGLNAYVHSIFSLCLIFACTIPSSDVRHSNGGWRP